VKVTKFTEDIEYLNLKMVVFWVVAPCSLIEVYRRFRGSAVSIISDKHLWYFGKAVPVYTAQQPTRQPSSYSPPSETEISLFGPLPHPRV
jgi:hypothetical protein